jgi:Protein of unknown function (DUF3604)
MKRNTRLRKAAFAAVAAIGLALPALAQAVEADPRLMGPGEKTPEEYSPYVNQNFPDRVLWGATHIHTGLSADAGLTGVTLLPADMFRYARGEVVTIDSGLKVRLDRPLDWFAITDHAEYLGLADELRSSNPALLADPTGKRWYEMYKQSPQEAFKAGFEVINSISQNKEEIKLPQLTASAWAKAYEAAERYNQPGVFTTLHGFEWTSAPEGNNLHRTVIFRDGVDRVKQIVPFSAFDSQNPEDLWKYMDRYEKHGRQGPRHPAQRQSQQWPHVHGRDLRRETHGHGLRRGSHQPRAGHGGDAGQG